MDHYYSAIERSGNGRGGQQKEIEEVKEDSYRKKVSVTIEKDSLSDGESKSNEVLEFTKSYTKTNSKEH
jgi:hypothetical protein